VTRLWCLQIRPLVDDHFKGRHRAVEGQFNEPPQGLFRCFCRVPCQCSGEMTELGVGFQYLEPVNEGLEGWVGQGVFQEGCSFSAQDISRLYPILQAALEKKKPAHVHAPRRG